MKYHFTNKPLFSNRSSLSLTRYPGELLCVEAASGVHPKGGPADEGRSGREQKGDSRGDLVWGAQPLSGDFWLGHLKYIHRVVGSGSVGKNHSGSHTIHTNTTLGEFDRKGSGKKIFLISGKYGIRQN